MGGERRTKVAAHGSGKMAMPAAVIHTFTQYILLDYSSVAFDVASMFGFGTTRCMGGFQNNRQTLRWVQKQPPKGCMRTNSRIQFIRKGAQPVRDILERNFIRRFRDM